MVNPDNKSKRVGKSVNGVSYESGNYRLVSGSDDKSVKIWYRKFDEPHPKKQGQQPVKKVVVREDDDDDEMTEDEKMYHRMVKTIPLSASPVWWTTNKGPCPTFYDCQTINPDS